MTVTDSPRRILVRFAPMVYGPTVLFALGEGAVIPLIPVIASALGADVAGAGLVAAALVVGQLVGNLPAGWAVARFGERLTMLIAGVVALVGALGLMLAPNLAVFAASVLLIGVSAAAYGLARHSFMTTRVPVSFRARSLSMLGGTFRLGMFAGPFLSAGLLAVFGDEDAVIWLLMGCLLATMALVAFGPDPHTALAPSSGGERSPAAEDTGEAVTGPLSPVGDGRREGVFRTMWRFRAVLSRLGVAGASLSAVRSARQVVLPLWGVSLGLDAQTIALVVGVAGAIDFTLFYASGQVMDRFGRLWAALPAMTLMALGFFALSLTHDLPDATLWYGVLGTTLGVANGLSSGILLTLAADAAPPADPAPFLGSWRTLTDAGGAAAPLLIAGVTAVASLPVAVASIGVVAALGAVGFARWVPRFVPRTG